MATGQEKKSAATGDNEQALAEAPTTATGQQEKSAATGAGDRVPMWHTDEVVGSIPGVFPSIFQNETGDLCNFKFVKHTCSHGAHACCVLEVGRLRQAWPSCVGG